MAFFPRDLLSSEVRGSFSFILRYSSAASLMGSFAASFSAFILWTDDSLGLACDFFHQS
jgi:hypothetical protein